MSEDRDLKEVAGGYACPECGHAHATLSVLKVGAHGAACARCGGRVTLPAGVKLSRILDGTGEATPPHVVAANEFLAFVAGLRTTAAVAVLGIPPACLAGEVAVHFTAERGGGIALLTSSARIVLDRRGAVNLLLALARALLPLDPPFDSLATKITIAK